jgi:outer membrane usher protein
MRGRQSLGFGAAMAVRGAGLLSAGIAAGRSARGGGVLQYLQFDRQGGDYAFTLRGQTAGRRFWQLGLDQDDAVPIRQVQAQANISVGARANLTFGYVGQRYAGPTRQERENFRAVNAGLSFDLQRNGTVSIGLLKPFIRDGALSASAVWVLPLERQSALQVLAGAQKNYRSLSAEYQRAAPQDGGWGYRARKDISGYGGRDVGVNYLGAAGEYRFSANRANGRNGLQLEARGGVALLGGHIMATRWLGESFAMVEVPVGRPIDIYANNIKVGRTGKNGVGFIPRLIPYESNDVYPDDAGLPLSISLDLAPKAIVPGNRTGSLLKFHARQNRSATLILVDRNSRPLATGVLVYVNGSAAVQEVALHGRVFVPAIDYPAAIVVHDAAGARCRFKIAQPLKKTVFPVLGPYICSRETK